MRPTWLTALALLISALLGGQAWAIPVVLATIKPVHSLVAAVMEGVGKPELLIRGAQSEHSYALKPSDAERIARANLIFEIGPDLETYLERPLESLKHGKLVVLEKARGVQLLPARHGGLWEDAGEDEGPPDPHVWLDPGNAISMTRAIAEALSKADPAHTGRYRNNATLRIALLQVLAAKVNESLTAVKSRHYLVFHDGYRYFEHRFGLHAVGAVTVAPERPIGPRRIAMLRERIASGDIACVFREPQFPPRLIETLTEGSDARTGVLDPIGAGLAPGPELYDKLLLGLSNSLATCLAKPH